MLLGNATSGVAVALSSILSGLKDGAAVVEARLALGATRWEATNELLRRSVNMGLTPVLNQMSIIGLVSIPGMMTGQILSGSPPSTAARYQARNDAQCHEGWLWPAHAAAETLHVVSPFFEQHPRL